MKLGQGNIFTSVCQEFCPQGGRVSASLHAGIPPLGADTPRTRYPPWTRRTTPWSRPPPEQTPLEADNPQTRHSPWDQTPPSGADDPPRPGTPTGSRPPRNRTPPPRINVRPVRILLECILVYIYHCL